MSTTWKPHVKHGELNKGYREEIPDSVYAFPKQRNEPLTDTDHVEMPWRVQTRSSGYPIRIVIWSLPIF